MTSINLHRVTHMTAKWYKEHSWLEIETANGTTVGVHVAAHTVEALAAAWNEAESYEPEPPTYDEALGAKCDAEARMDEIERDEDAYLDPDRLREDRDERLRLKFEDMQADARAESYQWRYGEPSAEDC